MSKEGVRILLAGEGSNELAPLVVKLQEQGFTVVSVVDREKIVTLARSEVPQLILLDLHSCFDVCRMLKRSFVTEAIPIIALLFPAVEADRIAVFELGADDCMAKPYSFRELNIRITKSVARARDKDGNERYKKAQSYSALTRPQRNPRSS